MSREEQSIADPGSHAPLDDGLETSDPLRFPGYADSRTTAAERCGARESVTAGPATIDGVEVELALFEFRFLGGSMGEVAGERLARSIERAATKMVPFVLRTSTGGARMQEGMMALVQMPKLVVARRLLSDAHVPFLAVFGDPTTGGVLASLGSLGDVTVAEAGATIGFAGPRVAERFTGRPLEGGSHSAATAFQHGLVDEVVPSSEVRAFLASALRVLASDETGRIDEADDPPLAAFTRDPWELVGAARDLSAPSAVDLLGDVVDPLVFLRGDRAGTDDPALSIAIGRIHGRRALIVALERAHQPGPGAYRKARRSFDVAVRLGIPIVTLVDTRGADPSADSENAGIATEIAATFDSLLHAPVPTLSLVTGEGGSGGALAFASTDVVLARETSFFSVIAPEAAAEILWRDADRAAEAARLLKLSGHDLLQMGIADALLPDLLAPAELARKLAYHLDRLKRLGADELLAARKTRWRRRI